MPIAQVKQILRPCVPLGLLEQHSRWRKGKESREETLRRQRFNELRSEVRTAVAAIGALTAAQCLDADFLEKQFIPSLGLNDEILAEQPPELSANFGKGLHIWQYPNQLAGYLVWLAGNAPHITSYMEIGCRWGGMFILISEWIRKNGGQLRAVTAVDPIRPTPFIETYFGLLRDQAAAGHSPIQTTYLCDFSTSASVRQAVDSIRPDFVFIDGDHGLRSALSDHILVRSHAQFIVHHDVCSQACPDIAFLWRTLKQLEAHEFEFIEFLRQYPSVKGNFLGIGAMKRRTMPS